MILTPLMAPRSSAHAERWIGSCRRECMDRMMIIDELRLGAVMDEYCAHYNDERPHRSRNLRPPAARGDPGRPAAGSNHPTGSAGRIAQRLSARAGARVTCFSNSTG